MSLPSTLLIGGCRGDTDTRQNGRRHQVALTPERGSRSDNKERPSTILYNSLTHSLTIAAVSCWHWHDGSLSFQNERSACGFTFEVQQVVSKNLGGRLVAEAFSRGIIICFTGSPQGGVAFVKRGHDCFGLTPLPVHILDLPSAPCLE